MRAVRVEEEKVHLSGREEGWGKKGKRSIREYLWGECELVNESLKRTHTHTSTYSSRCCMPTAHSFILGTEWTSCSPNLSNLLFKDDLTDRYSLDRCKVYENAGFKGVLAWKKKSSGTNTRGQPDFLCFVPGSLCALSSLSLRWQSEEGLRDLFKLWTASPETEPDCLGLRNLYCLYVFGFVSVCVCVLLHKCTSQDDFLAQEKPS